MPKSLSQGYFHWFVLILGLGLVSWVSRDKLPLLYCPRLSSDGYHCYTCIALELTSWSIQLTQREKDPYHPNSLASLYNQEPIGLK